MGVLFLHVQLAHALKDKSGPWTQMGAPPVSALWLTLCVLRLPVTCIVTMVCRQMKWAVQFVNAMCVPCKNAELHVHMGFEQIQLVV